MIYIEAPNRAMSEKISVFLAGGISNCPDWQSYLVNLLKPYDITIYNPRRKKFSIENSSESEKQIKWEFDHLNKCDIYVFWFCKATLCPIVLFELGSRIKDGKPISIGIEPGYEREKDVKIQTNLVKPELKITNSLEALSKDILDNFLKMIL